MGQHTKFWTLSQSHWQAKKGSGEFAHLCRLPKAFLCTLVQTPQSLSLHICADSPEFFVHLCRLPRVLCTLVQTPQSLSLHICADSPEIFARLCRLPRAFLCTLVQTPQSLSLHTCADSPEPFFAHLCRLHRAFLCTFVQTPQSLSLHICADSPEPLLLACTKHQCRWRLRQRYRPPAPLNLSAWVFKGAFYIYIIMGWPHVPVF